MPKIDGELSDEELEQVAGGSKDMKYLFEHWRGYLEEQQDALNVNLWMDDTLKADVRDHLLKIAQEFIDKTEAKNIEIKDIVITGSLANYNYTEYSDIDLHIIVDFNDIDNNYALVKDYFDATKALWNYLHDIFIKDHEVEIYVQDVGEEHHSTGVYSLMKDEWQKKPIYKKAKYDQELVNKKTASLIDQIDRATGAMKTENHKEALERASAISDKIKKMRRGGLESEGEYSVENMAFKELRNGGYLKKLSDLKREAYDLMMSLDEDR
jgi:predicted nucleotidyltransferase